MRTLPILCWGLLLAGCTANARLDVSEFRPQDQQAAGGEPARPVRYGNEITEPADRAGGPRVVNGWEADHEKTSSMKSNEVYVVREGDTLYNVARRHGVTLAMLYSANTLINDRLTPGQHILIPRHETRPQ